MNVYYRRYITWCKWPWNDEKETDVVQFSTNAKHFDKGIFAQCEPSLSVPDRLRMVSEKLERNPKKITLVKRPNYQ